MSTNEYWFQSGGSNFYDSPIANSLIFDRDSTQYLSRTPSSEGNRQKWTWSSWVKRTNLGTVSRIITAGSGATEVIGFLNTDKLQIYSDTIGFHMQPQRLFRDTSAWYHIVVALDTAQATASNRLKLYINGVLETNFSALNYPGQNTSSYINTTQDHNIGRRRQTGGELFDGYMAEINFIDGQALNATSFGEFKSGVWIPKEYSGSYGTQGYYLKLNGNANDSSGNGNNFTGNGSIGSWQYVSDSPTQNFCKFSQIDRTDTSGSFDFSFGDLHTKGWGNGGPDFRASMGMRTGKWYWEFRSNYNYVDGMNTTVGIMASGWRDLTTSGKSYGFYGYLGTKDAPLNWPGSAHFGSSFASGDIYMIAFDADNGKIWFGKNGSWYNNGSTDGSANPATGTNPAYSGIDTNLNTFQPFLNFYDAYGSRPSIYWNFGQNPTFNGATTAGTNTDESTLGLFKYSVPSGFNCLCSINLPVAEGVDPALDNSPQDHIDALPYTGNGNTTTGQTLTGLNFRPDLVWIKNRTSAVSHVWHDVIRGTDAEGYIPLSSDSGNAESVFNSTWHNNYGEMSAITNDGFTVVNGTATSNYNGTNANYASWNFKAGGSGVSNTLGSINTTVSANQDAGFSIISYTGNGSSIASIGHGLSEIPELVIFKLRNGTSNWLVQSDIMIGDASAGNYLLLNSTNAKATSSTVNTDFFANVITIDSNSLYNLSGGNYIAYAFHRVPGYCDMGIFEGNGSADGTFVYTGFKPKIIIWKALNSAQNWFIKDIERSEYNVSAQSLFPGRNLAENNASNWYIDFLSNGFKQRNTDVQSNSSSVDYAWIAFAETPFKYATAH